MFSSYLKRLSIDVFCIFSIVTMAVLFCAQLLPFINAAAGLGSLNFAIILYILYALFLTVLPMVLVSSQRINKVKIIRVLCIGLSAILIIGTLYDLAAFRLFTKPITDIDYSSSFGNMLWNTNGFGGTLLGIVTALCYISFAVQIKHTRRI